MRKKDNLIRKNPNLTDGQKQEIIDLLARHPSLENKIDWNRKRIGKNTKDSRKL